jgi:hypothetical protein
MNPRSIIELNFFFVTGSKKKLTTNWASSECQILLLYRGNRLYMLYKLRVWIRWPDGYCRWKNRVPKSHKSVQSLKQNHERCHWICKIFYNLGDTVHLAEFGTEVINLTQPNTKYLIDLITSNTCAVLTNSRTNSWRSSCASYLTGTLEN